MRKVGDVDARIAAAGLTLIAVLACADPASQAADPTLQEAEASYSNLDLQEAGRRFRSVLESEAAPTEDRAKAARQLSIIAWRFQGDSPEANALLTRAADLGLSPADRWFEQSRRETHDGDYAAARHSARHSLQFASTREEIARAQVRHAAALFEEMRRLGPAVPPSALLESSLHQARRSLTDLVSAEPGSLDASRLLLGIALMAGDGAAALQGWRSYYWILPGDEAVPLLHRAASILEEKLPGWSRAADGPTRQAVSRALAQSGFHRIAAWVAAGSGTSGAGSDAGSTEIVAYAAFLDRVSTIAESYYRLSALGEGSRRVFGEEFDSAGRALWAELSWSGGAPRFTRRSFAAEIQKRFGSSFKFEEHDGVLCLHLGFVLIDREYTVEQYGHAARLRFRVLDMMISNGYNSWFWDGAAAAGGWVDEEGSIVQVRPAYAEGPIRAWRQVAHDEDRRALEEKILEKSLSDDDIAREKEIAYLPGLSLRLRRRGYTRILEELQASGMAGEELRSAFTRELSRRIHASSILAHEGRHAIDKRSLTNFLRPGSEKEFRAKLSEVALAPDPGLALTGGILFSNIGGSSSHGQANARIVGALVNWMRDHEAEIGGLDPARPLLPQLDLLTDAQLRAAIQAVDPMARDGT